MCAIDACGLGQRCQAVKRMKHLLGCSAQQSSTACRKKGVSAENGLVPVVAGIELVGKMVWGVARYEEDLQSKAETFEDNLAAFTNNVFNPLCQAGLGPVNNGFGALLCQAEFR